MQQPYYFPSYHPAHVIEPVGLFGSSVVAGTMGVPVVAETMGVPVVADIAESFGPPVDAGSFAPSANAAPSGESRRRKQRKSRRRKRRAL
jgi:hypothetical protein